MFNRLWQGVQSMLTESVVASATAASGPTLPVCDMAVTDPARVLELLRLLESDNGRLSLQSSTGQLLGHAKVFAVTSRQVTLQCSASFAVEPEQAVNVVGSSPRGAVMFTLNLVSTSLGDLWRSALPNDVLCVQSRQHHRVEVVHALGHQVELLTSAPGAVRRVLDLSESGAALDLNNAEATLWTEKPVVLVLDGMKLQVPRLEVVHCHAIPEGRMRAGVRLGQMRSDDTRQLRRWLNQAETALLSPLQ